MSRIMREDILTTLRFFGPSDPRRILEKLNNRYFAQLGFGIDVGERFYPMTYVEVSDMVRECFEEGLIEKAEGFSNFTYKIKER